MRVAELVTRASEVQRHWPLFKTVSEEVAAPSRCGPCCNTYRNHWRQHAPDRSQEGGRAGVARRPLSVVITLHQAQIQDYVSSYERKFIARKHHNIRNVTDSFKCSVFHFAFAATKQCCCRLPHCWRLHQGTVDLRWLLSESEKAVGQGTHVPEEGDESPD